jgi:hypothetical protein
MPRSPTPQPHLSRSVVASLGGLLLALVVSGCFGSSGTSSGKGSAELVVTVTRSILGQPPTRDRYYIYCTTTGDQSPAMADVCRRLGAYRNQYFGTAHKDLVSDGPEQAALTVRGQVDGATVRRSYDLGASPQYPDWMRLLAKLRRAPRA